MAPSVLRSIATRRARPGLTRAPCAAFLKKFVGAGKSCVAQKWRGTLVAIPVSILYSMTMKILLAVLILCLTLTAAHGRVGDSLNERSVLGGEEGEFVHSEDYFGDVQAAKESRGSAGTEMCKVHPWYDPYNPRWYRDGDLCGYWKTHYPHHERRELHKISVCCLVDDGVIDDEYECVVCMLLLYNVDCCLAGISVSTCFVSRHYHRGAAIVSPIKRSLKGAVSHLMMMVIDC